MGLNHLLKFCTFHPNSSLPGTQMLSKYLLLLCSILISGAYPWECPHVVELHIAAVNSALRFQKYFHTLMCVAKA